MIVVFTPCLQVHQYFVACSQSDGPPPQGPWESFESRSAASVACQRLLYLSILLYSISTFPSHQSERSLSFNAFFPSCSCKHKSQISSISISKNLPLVQRPWPWLSIRHSLTGNTSRTFDNITFTCQRHGIPIATAGLKQTRR